MFRALVLVSVLLLATVGAASAATYGTPPPDPKACAAAGGKLQKVCVSQTLACLVPFRDEGRPCTDKPQCQGRCIAVGRPAPDGRVRGRCEVNHGPCGCFTEVVRGKVGTSICVD